MHEYNKPNFVLTYLFSCFLKKKSDLVAVFDQLPASFYSCTWLAVIVQKIYSVSCTTVNVAD